MQHFVYIWHDKIRNMFYVGSHSGTIDDGYISSSKWLTAEINYRTNDFRRKIICFCESKNEAQKVEGSLLSKIKEHEFGKKYYNMKHGKPKGSDPWNKGKTGVYSKEYIDKLVASKKGKPSVRKGIPNKSKA